LQLGARWILPQSDYSVNLLATAGLHNYDNPDSDFYGYSAKFLLSNDLLGLAIGPTVDSTGYLSGQPYAKFGISAPYVASHFGVAVLAEPFRITHVAVLKDVTFEGSAIRSIGQAGFQPYQNGKVGETILAGTLRFNFNY
jgi:hypothetical protein